MSLAATVLSVSDKLRLNTETEPKTLLKMDLSAQEMEDSRTRRRPLQVRMGRYLNALST